MRREALTDAGLLTRVGLVVGAILCAALAVGLALLAVDVAHWRSTLPADDVRYRASPGDSDLWVADELVPLGLPEKTLGLGDDLELRRAVRALRSARIGDPFVTDPELTLRRNDAQVRLEEIASGDMAPEWRSRAAGLLGVVGLARLGSESQDRTALVLGILSNLRLAISLDPSNEEAKYNLELVLQQSSGIELGEGGGGANPSPGGSGVKGAGTGDPGSGY